MTKGAPQVIAKLCGAENFPEMKMRVEAEVANLGSRGIRSLAVARTYDAGMESFELMGMLTFLDPPRPDTKHTIEQVRRGGVPAAQTLGSYAFTLHSQSMCVISQPQSAGCPLPSPRFRFPCSPAGC